MQNSPNEFLTPQHIDVTSKSPTHARIILEPLERGFGHTLGFALKQTMLMCLPGTALVKVKINSILEDSFDLSVIAVLNISFYIGK